jgi:uncharacterized membrane protein (UPF0127 family)
VLGVEVAFACRFDARLLGLAWLDRDQAGAGLLIPRCAAVHTFGMRFPLDLVFLDERGSSLSTCRRVPRRRFVSCRGAAAVLEIPSSEGGEFLSRWT